MKILSTKFTTHCSMYVIHMHFERRRKLKKTQQPLGNRFLVRCYNIDRKANAIKMRSWQFKSLAIDRRIDYDRFANFRLIFACSRNSIAWMVRHSTLPPFCRTFAFARFLSMDDFQLIFRWFTVSMMINCVTCALSYSRSFLWYQLLPLIQAHEIKIFIFVYKWKLIKLTQASDTPLTEFSAINSHGFSCWDRIHCDGKTVVCVRTSEHFLHRSIFTSISFPFNNLTNQLNKKNKMQKKTLIIFISLK